MRSKKAVDEIGNMMDAFKKEGFDFGYHNHGHQFKKFDWGKYPMDYIRSINGIKFQPDVFWLKTAGIDPVEFIKENSDALISIHMNMLKMVKTLNLVTAYFPGRKLWLWLKRQVLPLALLSRKIIPVHPLTALKFVLTI